MTKSSFYSTVRCSMTLCAVVSIAACNPGSDIAIAESESNLATADWETLDSDRFELSASWITGDYLHKDLEAMLPTVSLDDLDLNREASKRTTNSATEVLGVDRYHTGFRWDDGDQSVIDWMPQGVTGSGSAWSTGTTPGGKKFLAVSWYYKGSSRTKIPHGCVDRGNDDYNKGVRISFVDLSSMDDIRYRHVLLVEPFRRDDGVVDYCPVMSHAGGLAWYRNYLYVAETGSGFRIYDMRKILKVATGDNGVAGKREDGKYHAFNYQYVMPQVGAYQQDSNSEQLRFSWVSVDQTTSPHSLVTGEYCNLDDDPTKQLCNLNEVGRIARWNLNSYTGRLGRSSVHGATLRPTEVLATAEERMQGGLSANAVFLVGKSNGKTSNGKLVRARRSCAVARRGGAKAHTWALGSEDMHYSPLSDNVWTCTEYDGKRSVFAVKMADYQ